MNDTFGFYACVNGKLMCFATEVEYLEYIQELKEEQDIKSWYESIISAFILQ